MQQDQKCQNAKKRKSDADPLSTQCRQQNKKVKNQSQADALPPPYAIVKPCTSSPPVLNTRTIKPRRRSKHLLNTPLHILARRQQRVVLGIHRHAVAVAAALPALVVVAAAVVVQLAADVVFETLGVRPDGDPVRVVAAVALVEVHFAGDVLVADRAAEAARRDGGGEGGAGEGEGGEGEGGELHVVYGLTTDWFVDLGW
ncbi:hypothetical protein EDC01DRAFT_664220 [Geopyxis carbonaria]|nr:hypothetical protein EDC01DRAFT_664220 [Geopyxis carbonaria]